MSVAMCTTDGPPPITLASARDENKAYCHFLCTMFKDTGVKRRDKDKVSGYAATLARSEYDKMLSHVPDPVTHESTSCCYDDATCNPTDFDWDHKGTSTGKICKRGHGFKIDGVSPPLWTLDKSESTHNCEKMCPDNCIDCTVKSQLGGIISNNPTDNPTFDSTTDGVWPNQFLEFLAGIHKEERKLTATCNGCAHDYVLINNECKTKAATATEGDDYFQFLACIQHTTKEKCDADSYKTLANDGTIGAALTNNCEWIDDKHSLLKSVATTTTNPSTTTFGHAGADDDSSPNAVYFHADAGNVETIPGQCVPKTTKTKLKTFDEDKNRCTVNSGYFSDCFHPFEEDDVVLIEVHDEPVQYAGGKACTSGQTKVGSAETPKKCWELIKAHDNCNQQFFNFLDFSRASILNCGCVQTGVDCSSSAEQSENDGMSIYSVEDAPIVAVVTGTNVDNTWSFEEYTVEMVASGSQCIPLSWLGVSGNVSPNLIYTNPQTAEECLGWILLNDLCDQDATHFTYTHIDKNCACVTLSTEDCIIDGNDTADVYSFEKLGSSEWSLPSLVANVKYGGKDKHTYSCAVDGGALYSVTDYMTESPFLHVLFCADFNADAIGNVYDETIAHNFAVHKQDTDTVKIRVLTHENEFDEIYIGHDLALDGLLESINNAGQCHAQFRRVGIADSKTKSTVGSYIPFFYACTPVVCAEEDVDSRERRCSQVPLTQHGYPNCEVKVAKIWHHDNDDDALATPNPNPAWTVSDYKAKLCVPTFYGLLADEADCPKVPTNTDRKHLVHLPIGTDDGDVQGVMFYNPIERASLLAPNFLIDTTTAPHYTATGDHNEFEQHAAICVNFQTKGVECESKTPSEETQQYTVCPDGSTGKYASKKCESLDQCGSYMGLELGDSQYIKACESYCSECTDKDGYLGTTTICEDVSKDLSCAVGHRYFPISGNCLQVQSLNTVITYPTTTLTKTSTTTTSSTGCRKPCSEGCNADEECVDGDHQTYCTASQNTYYCVPITTTPITTPTTTQTITATTTPTSFELHPDVTLTTASTSTPFLGDCCDTANHAIINVSTTECDTSQAHIKHVPVGTCRVGDWSGRGEWILLPLVGPFVLLLLAWAAANACGDKFRAAASATFIVVVITCVALQWHADHAGDGTLIIVVRALAFTVAFVALVVQGRNAVKSVGEPILPWLLLRDGTGKEQWTRVCYKYIHAANVWLVYGIAARMVYREMDTSKLLVEVVGDDVRTPMLIVAVGLGLQAIPISTLIPTKADETSDAWLMKGANACTLVLFLSSSLYCFANILDHPVTRDNFAAVIATVTAWGFYSFLVPSIDHENANHVIWELILRIAGTCLFVVGGALLHREINRTHIEYSAFQTYLETDTFLVLAFTIAAVYSGFVVVVDLTLLVYTFASCCSGYKQVPIIF